MIWWLVACGDPCRPGGTPTLEIGLGRDTYFPAEDGDDGLLVYGPQGGQHVDLAISATHLDPSSTASSTIEGRLNGTVVAAGAPWFDLTCEQDTQRAWGLRMLLEVPPEQVDGQTIEVDVTVRDAKGTEVSAQRTLHIVDPVNGG